MRTLTIAPMPYPPSALDAWKAGDYGLIETSQASAFLREVLPSKARTRRASAIARGKKPSSWFFGEAYVATQIPHRDGWYSSFKWLTGRRWAPEGEIDGVPHSQLRDALRILGDLQRLQEAAHSLITPAGSKPVAPDLWLFADGVHRFIEVKMPGDTIKRHQLAGLAVLATCIPLGLPVSVEIISLHPERRSDLFDAETARVTFADLSRLLDPDRNCA